MIDLSVPLSTSSSSSSTAASAPISLRLSLPSSDKAISLPLLQRLRRTFVKMHGSSIASVGMLGDAARHEAAQEGNSGEAQVAKRFAAWICESL